jgi:hypothetical protein
MEHNVYVERDIWRERAATIARLRALAEAALRLCHCKGTGRLPFLRVNQDDEIEPSGGDYECPACGPLRRGLDAPATGPAGGPEDPGEGCDA